MMQHLSFNHLVPMHQPPWWMTYLISIMNFSGSREDLEQYLATSRQHHKSWFNAGRIAFANNHIIYKTAKFHKDAPADQEDKMCLDVPFDIGLCARTAINCPHFHGLHYNKETKSWRQFYIAKVDLPIGVNVVRGQVKLDSAVICLIVKDYRKGLDNSLYVHTLHLRKTENKLLEDSLGKYVQVGDTKLLHNHRNLFREPKPQALPTVSTESVEPVPSLGTPYQPNPFGISS